MTLTQLQTKVSYYLDDSNNIRWPLAEVTNYINQAYRFYWNKLVNASYNGILATPATLDLVAGTSTVALPSDFYKAKNIYRVLDDKSVPLDYREGFDDYIYSEYSMGTYMPSVKIRGSNLVFNPPPQSSVTGGIMIEYWPVITELSAVTDEPAFTEQWQEIIPMKAALIAKAMREEEDVQNIAEMLAMEENMMNDSIQSMTNQRSSTDPYVIGEGY